MPVGKVGLYAIKNELINFTLQVSDMIELTIHNRFTLHLLKAFRCWSFWKASGLNDWQDSPLR